MRSEAEARLPKVEVYARLARNSATAPNFRVEAFRASAAEAEAMRRTMDLVEMPDQMAQNLLRFIRENQGKLGKKRRENEFAKLTDEEVAGIEAIVREAFEGFPNT
jgi:hypothetical protein